MPDPLTITATPLAEAEAEWDALADATAAGPFQRAGWFAAWARAFGGELEILTARRDGRLAGALALRRGPRWRTSPTNWHSPLYGPVAESPQVAETLAGAALEHSGAWLDCSFLDPADPFTAALRQAPRRSIIARPVLHSPCLRLEGDYESYAATRPSKLYREIRRRRRRLQDDHGEVTVEFSDGGAELDRLLGEGLAVEGSGWKTERGTAIAQDAAVEGFYRDVAVWAAERGWLQLAFVRVDGRAVAFSYALVLAGTVNVVKVGFDPGYARYAVGTLLTSHAIERAFEQGLEIYDFLGGEDRYKLDWTDEVRERVRVQAFARTPAGTAALLAWRHGRPAALRGLELARSRRERA